MKKIVICSFNLLLLISVSSFSQRFDSARTLTSEDYLKKSKSQKIAGFIFLGIGITTIAIISQGNTSFDVLPVFAGLGAAATLGSIPLFIASGRNKRRARETSANLKVEKCQSIQETRINFHAYPAIAIKVNL